MNKKSPSVAIILVNWKTPSDTIECIDSLINLNYSGFKVFVVDNGSNDGSDTKIQKHINSISLDCELIKSNENLGFSGGNNIAIKKAIEEGFQWFWLLNNDTIAQKDSLSTLVDFGLQNKNAGILGSKIYYFNSNKIWYAGGYVDYKTGKGSSIGRDEVDNGQYDIAKKCDYITGCSMLVRKEVIDSIGLLEDGFFLYYEDTDWSLRARLKGWNCYYVPTSIIEHKVGKSSEEGYSSPFLSYYNLRNRYLMTRRNKELFTKSGPLFFLLKKGFANIYFAILRKDRKIERIKYSLWGVIDGIRNKMGKHK